MSQRLPLIAVTLITLSLALMPLRSFAMMMGSPTDNTTAVATMAMDMDDAQHHNCCPEQSGIDHQGCDGGDCSGGCCAPAATPMAQGIHHPAHSSPVFSVSAGYFENIPPIELQPPRPLSRITS